MFFMCIHFKSIIYDKKNEKYTYHIKYILARKMRSCTVIMVFWQFLLRNTTILYSRTDICWSGDRKDS